MKDLERSERQALEKYNEMKVGDLSFNIYQINILFSSLKFSSKRRKIPFSDFSCSNYSHTIVPQVLCFQMKKIIWTRACNLCTKRRGEKHVIWCGHIIIAVVKNVFLDVILQVTHVSPLSTCTRCECCTCDSCEPLVYLPIYCNRPCFC